MSKLRLPDSGRENMGDEKKMVIFMQNGIEYLLKSHAEIWEILSNMGSGNPCQNSWNIRDQLELNKGCGSSHIFIYFALPKGVNNYPRHVSMSTTQNQYISEARPSTCLQVSMSHVVWHQSSFSTCKVRKIICVQSRLG